MDNIILLDCETTGFSDPRMIQLAYKTGKYTFESLYNPTKEIDEGAIEVHGITDEMVKDKEEFPLSVDQSILQLLLNKHILVAHNIKFDLNILGIEGVQAPKSICTYQCCLHILKRANTKGNNKLQNLKEEFKLEIPEGAKAHDAMGDVIVLEQLFHYILDKMEGVIDEKIKRMIEVSR